MGPLVNTWNVKCIGKYLGNESVVRFCVRQQQIFAVELTKSTPAKWTRRLFWCRIMLFIFYVYWRTMLLFKEENSICLYSCGCVLQRVFIWMKILGKSVISCLDRIWFSFWMHVSFSENPIKPYVGTVCFKSKVFVLDSILKLLNFDSKKF